MFHVVPSNKQELLTQVLIAFIQDDYAANKRHVFDASSIVVESQGMKHYLNMEIAKQTGLAMNIDYPLVSREIYRICRLVLGDDVPHDSPYKREYLVWNIYGILQSDVFSEQPQATLANAYWQSQNDPNLQCFRLAKQVADIFEQYSIYRSDWLAQWEQGNTLGLSDALEPWQQLIWRMLTQDNKQHPAYLRAAAIEGLANATELLPNPLYIFAVNTLSPTQITFFSELAKHTDVYLFFLNPCSEYWGDLVSDKVALKRQLANSIEILQAEEQRHPLLANLGSQGRALFNQLQDIHYPDITDNQLFIAPELDGHNATSILHTIQADIASGMLNPTAINAIERDRSLQIHSCYSPVREVQVLHDELLRILQHDPSIQPHEILVMCPSVEEYAPFVNSVFRPVHKPQAPGSPQLVCSIADRAPLDSESAVMMFLDMLELPDSRFSVLKIIDYLHIPMVQTKLTLTPDELSMCQLWLEQANIKWGVNAAHKNGILHSTDSDEIYSWEWGLQRLALGCLHSAAAGQPANYDYVIAIEGLNTRVLAKLLVLIELLKQFRNALTGAKSIAQWVVLLQEMLAELFASPNQEEVLKTIHKAVVDLGKQVEFAGYEGLLELAIIRESLTDRFSIPDALNQFLTGQVTFSSMVPMRSVPFKMICILGLNDGVFPRVSAPNSIDLIAVSPPQKGDRSRRNEDRYLFLEAILSAREYLYLSYQGQSVKDNQTLEPSLVLQEFIDYLNRKFITPDCFAETVIQVQPLQPFSTSLFDTSSELYHEKGSYDQGWLSLALHQPHRHDVSHLDVHKNIYIDESDLINLLKNPFKLLVNHQYQIFLDEFINLKTDIEPFNLDALTKDKLLSVAVSQGQLIAAGEVVDALDDYRQPLINRGDISSWMLENIDMKPYEQAAANIAQALTGVNLTTEIRHIHLHKTVQNVPFYIQASVAMDPEYRTDTLIHKEGSTAKRPEFSLAVLFRHCLKLCYFQQTGDTTLRYLKAKTVAKQATFGIESVTIPSKHISLADAEELIELLLSVYYHALQTPTFVHLALHNDLQAKLPDDATCYSEIPNVAFLLDNLGEQRQDKFSGMKWFLNTYCTWLFPHGFKHQDIDLMLLSRLYLHPLIQQAVSGVFVVPDKKPKKGASK